MPKQDGKRYFMSDEKIPRRFFYEVDSWVRQGDFPHRRKRLTEDDLPGLDFAVFKVYSEDESTHVSYTTIYGPADDWQFIEGVLAYDYGDEGSRIAPSTSSDAGSK